MAIMFFKCSCNPPRLSLWRSQPRPRRAPRRPAPPPGRRWPPASCPPPGRGRLQGRVQGGGEQRMRGQAGRRRGTPGREEAAALLLRSEQAATAPPPPAGPCGPCMVFRAHPRPWLRPPEPPAGSALRGGGTRKGRPWRQAREGLDASLGRQRKWWRAEPSPAVAKEQAQRSTGLSILSPSSCPTSSGSTRSAMAPVSTAACGQTWAVLACQVAHVGRSGRRARRRPRRCRWPEQGAPSPTNTRPSRLGNAGGPPREPARLPSPSSLPTHPCLCSL